MREIANFTYRAALFFLVILILGSLVTIAGLFIFDVPAAAYRLGTPDPGLNPVERVLLSTYLALNEKQLQMPGDNPEIPVELEVLEGQSAVDVIDSLRSAGVLSNPFLFRMYLRYTGYDRGIEAGSYRLQGGLSLLELALALQNAAPGDIVFTVIPGWRIEEIAQAISSSYPSMQVADILAAFSMRAIGTSFEDELPIDATLEGYLLPDTYTLQPDDLPEDITFMLLDNFDSRVTLQIRQAILAQGLSLHEGIILASIIEREAVLPEEMPLIASVYLNRLNVGMRLEADPTVQYPLGIEGRWWKSPLTNADLTFDSPYNTYLYAGLPPGPIANPSLAAIEAVGRPEVSPYFFFRAMCDGSGRHLFAVTYEEHLQNACP
ncbi:MAG: endolytic transglycosylase MltG [Anaerolineales bacterium]|nr:endolytic transglycosylase MltG [Anaerolineales bacterium]